jgi:hypothetical protein
MTADLTKEEADLVVGEMLAAWEATDGDDDPEIIARNRLAIGVVRKLAPDRVPEIARWLLTPSR